MKTIALAALLIAAALPFAVPAVSQEAADQDTIVQIKPKEGGWEIEDLFKTISDYTGQSIVFDPQSPQIARKKIEFVGVQSVPKSKLFGWFQSLLSFQRLILVPLGPEGHEQWMALDTNSPQITNRPIYLDEKEILDYADRDGVYVVSTIPVKYLKDTSRARNALAQLTTRAVGRINDVPGSNAFVVGDFAPVVASMYKLLMAMDTEAQNAPPAPTPEKKKADGASRAWRPTGEIAYYEKMLADSQTNVAAQYFIMKLNAVNTGPAIKKK